MKKIILIATVFLMFFFVGHSQDVTGPVLKKELAGKYEGIKKRVWQMVKALPREQIPIPVNF